MTLLTVALQKKLEVTILHFKEKKQLAVTLETVDSVESRVNFLLSEETFQLTRISVVLAKLKQHNLVYTFMLVDMHLELKRVKVDFFLACKVNVLKEMDSCLIRTMMIPALSAGLIHLKLSLVFNLIANTFSIELV